MKARTILAIAMITFAGLAVAEDTGVSWEQLSADQQRVLSSFSENWDSLTPERQMRLSTGAERWASMTPKQRDAALA